MGAYSYFCVVLKKLDELEKLGQQLEALKKRREGEWQAKEEEQARQEYQDQIQWFRTTADPAKRHQKNLGRKQAGTCRWLLQEPDYKRWKETSEIPLLWLSATQGCTYICLLGKYYTLQLVD